MTASKNHGGAFTALHHSEPPAMHTLHGAFYERWHTTGSPYHRIFMGGILDDLLRSRIDGLPYSSLVGIAVGNHRHTSHRSVVDTALR